MANASNPTRLAVAAVLLGVTVGGGIYLARQGTPPKPVPVVAPAPPAAMETPAVEPAVQHPIEQAIAEVVEPALPLPSLYDSDEPVLGALAGIGGADSLRGLLVTQNLIPRFVATIDNLPRAKLAPQLLPTKSVPGAFAVEYVGGQRAIAGANAKRYAPFVNALEASDAKQAVALYVKYYPLFQQAYRELGYPQGYFNDRLIEAIDHLLATPDAAPPLTVEQPKVFFVYADPELEAMSAGQKLMLRMGAENATRVKAKLREFRAALTGQTLPH